MFKRLLAFGISLLLLFSTCTFTVSANIRGFREPIYEETSEWITADELEILNKLGVSQWSTVKDMGEKVYDVVTRWMLADYIAQVLGLGTNGQKDFETLFTDLSSEHQYYVQIEAVVQAGYMKGDPTGKFRPNEAVTAKEAAIVLLRVLGYEPYMKVRGENEAFKMTDVLDGIPLSDEILLPQLLKLIYNMLCAPVVQQTGFVDHGNGNLDIKLEINDAYIGFENFMGVKFESGVLDGIRGSTLLKSEDIVKDNNIMIAGIYYECEDDVTDLLGYKVKYFYREGRDGTRKIIHITKSDKNEEVILTNDELDNFSGGVYTYFDDNKERKIQISNTTRIIYNDVAEPLLDDAKFIPDFGTVTFIDNDGETGYDVIKIENYDVYIISGVNETDKRVYYKVGTQSQYVDFDNCDLFTLCNSSGEIALAQLRENSVLMVKRSSNKSKFDRVYAMMITATYKAVKPSSISMDDIVLNDKSYNIWDKITTKIEQGTAYDFFCIGNTVVAAVEVEDKSAKYAYLIEAESEGTLSSKLLLSMVDLSLEYSVAEVAERVVIDGIRYKQLSLQTLKNYLQSTASIYSNGYSMEYPIAQPVKLSLDKDGRVGKIDTFKYDQVEESKESLQYVVEMYGKKPMYEEYNTSLYNLAEGSTTNYTKLATSISGETTVFFVPFTKTNRNGFFSNKAQGNGRKYLTNGDTFTVDVLGFDENSSVPEVVVVYMDDESASISSWTRPSVIFDLSKELDEEGNINCIVHSYYENQTKTYICDESLYNQLSIGDVYIFKTNRLSEIVQWTKVQAINDPLPSKGARKFMRSSSATYGLSRQIGIYWGTLLNFDGSFAKVCQSFTNDPEGFDILDNVDNFFLKSSSGVYKYTEVRGRPKVEKVMMSEAVPYTSDPEKAAKVLVSVSFGLDCIYIIDK